MFQIFIDNEEVICESNFEIKEEFMNPSSIELYKVYPKSWKGTNKLLTDYYYPDDYSKCKILRDGELYFTGIVKNSADMELNPYKPHYCSLQILDLSTLLSEGTTLDYVISNKNVKEAIIQVVDSISNYGFIVGNILIPEKDNTLIGAYSTLNKTAYDVFSYLSIISGTRWGTRMIDENTMAVDFYSPELLEKLGTIECSLDYYKKNKIENLTYDYSTTDYRNKQIITSNQVYSSINNIEQKIANGYNTEFITEQLIGKINSITINGEEKAFATNNEKEIGFAADFYYNPSESKFTSSDIYNAGTVIVINYIALVHGREITYSTPEINRIKKQLGINGIISRYEERNDSTSTKELQAISSNYIKFKGIAELDLNIISRVDFLVLGGKYHFNAPISKLEGDYLVKSKNTKVFQNGKILTVCYEYELTNSFDTENELNYFDNQRSKVNGNMEKGQCISRNIDIDNVANIVFSNLNIEKIEVDNILDNILDSILDSAL